MTRRRLAALALATFACLVGAPSQAASTAGTLRFCDRGTPMSAAQQDTLLRFAAVVKHELQAADARVALISRSGLDLARFGIRYSHAGLSLKASDGGAPWSVRQLYFSCDERRPRLYDQGIAGFVSGTDDPATGFISVVLLPPDVAGALERAALDRPRSLALLAPRYSANAYAYGLSYQNCNQWVVELMAAAWGRIDGGETLSLRTRAQDWLQGAGYAPAPVEIGSRWIMAAAGLVPWIYVDDHPESDRIAMRLHITLPSTIEAFVRDRIPGAQRIELCHDRERVVVRRGWTPIGERCEATSDADRVIAL